MLGPPLPDSDDASEEFSTKHPVRRAELRRYRIGRYPFSGFGLKRLFWLAWASGDDVRRYRYGQGATDTGNKA
jgi:hypothetical protein